MIDYKYTFIGKFHISKLDEKLYETIKNTNFILEGLEERWIIHDIRDAIKEKVTKKFKGE